MNIGIICYPSIGGSGLIATQLGLSLAKLGHQIHFISYSVPFKLSTFEPNVYFHEVEPINYPLFNQNLYTFSLTAKIIEVVNEYQLEIVHAHYSIPHSLSAHLAREVSKKNFKIITTLHGTDVTIVGQNQPLFPLNKYGIEMSDRVTTVSQFQKDHTRRYFDIKKEIDLIYNFVDTNVFKPGKGVCERSCLASTSQKIVMHISNFRQLKNPLGIINTFLMVKHQIEAKLVLVGEGPGLTEIKNFCSQHKLRDDVIYMGKIDRVESILPVADCVFLPSYMESFGMALLEAMSCAVPTVSSNVGGIPELVEHGKSGYYADPDDHELMAEYIVSICQSDSLAHQMGQEGRAIAETKFNQQDKVKQYVECYERELSR